MSSDGKTPRALANTDHDHMMGRMIERSDTLMREHQHLLTILNKVDGTLDLLGIAVTKLQSTIEMIGDLKHEDRMRALETRMTEAAPLLKSWQQVRDRFVLYAIVVAAVAIAAGYGGSHIPGAP